MPFASLHQIECKIMVATLLLYDINVVHTIAFTEFSTVMG